MHDRGIKFIEEGRNEKKLSLRKLMAVVNR